MAAKYDALVTKVRDWANKPLEATIPTSVIQDCLDYSADEIYRTLRIPPLEKTVTYTITSLDNAGSVTTDENKYSIIPIPEDLIQFVYIRQAPSTNKESIVFQEYTDERTFFDSYSDKYSRYNWVRRGNNICIHPQLEEGQIIEIHYYRRLAPLNATYLVIKENYEMGTSDALQPFFDVSNSTLGTPLYVTSTAAYNNVADVPAGQSYVTKYFTGKEVQNWLKENNERLLLWGALFNVGAYLQDDAMMVKYNKMFLDTLANLNKEEKYRRALGGNVQTNFNSRGLI
jgi:hypothetical protein